MRGRGRLDHLGLQAAFPESLATIRQRLIDAGDGVVDDFGPVRSMFFRDPDGLEGSTRRRHRHLILTRDHLRSGPGSSPGSRRAGATRPQDRSVLPSRASEMIRSWISDVPSKILVSRASRQ